MPEADAMPVASNDAAPRCFSRRNQLTLGVVLLNACVLTESVLMLARATNPFFGAMERPTPVFIAFMVLQIALLGASVVLSVAACTGNDKLVRANRALFWLSAVTNVAYAVSFALDHAWSGVALFVAVALLAALGAVLCRRLVLELQEHMQLPTESPSFVHHKMRADK